MKKGIALVLITAICAAMPIMNAWASEEVSEEKETYINGDYKYCILDDGTVQITGYTGSETGIEIPEEFDGMTVTSIGDIAFYFCTSLTSITIPKSVETIGTNPFLYCNSLTDIKVSEGNTKFDVIDGALYGIEGKILICYPCGLTAENFEIPQGIEQIGNDAFAGCSNLTEITIPDSVTTIGKSAFQSCQSLTEITIPNSVTAIDEYVFSGCQNLTNVTIPDNVTVIGQGAFISCASLTEIIIPDSVTTIGDNAFLFCSLTDVMIPKSVETIIGNPFAQCHYLTDIMVSVENTDFDVIDGALYDIKDKCLICYPCGFTAESFEIPQGTEQIGERSFVGCSALTEITIPTTVTTIEDSAFSSCFKLKEMTIPDSVTTIGSNAFSGCSDLTEITIPDSVTTIGENAFENCDNLTIIASVDSYGFQYALDNGISCKYE